RGQAIGGRIAERRPRELPQHPRGQPSPGVVGEIAAFRYAEAEAARWQRPRLFACQAGFQPAPWDPGRRRTMRGAWRTPGCDVGYHRPRSRAWLHVALGNQQVERGHDRVAGDAQGTGGPPRGREHGARGQAPVEDRRPQLPVQCARQRARAAPGEVQVEGENWLHVISMNWLTCWARLEGA